MQRAPCGAQRVGSFFHGGTYFFVETVGKILIRNSDPQTFYRRVQCGRIIWNGLMRAGCIHWIGTCEHAQQNGCVLYRVREGTHAIQRRSERDQSVTRHATIRGQQAHHSAERSGLANGATGICTQRGDCHVGGDGGCGASAGATRNTIESAGIMHRPIRGIFVRRAHGELVAVQFAQQHRACGSQLRHCSGVIRRTIVF